MLASCADLLVPLAVYVVLFVLAAFIELLHVLFGWFAIEEVRWDP